MAGRPVVVLLVCAVAGGCFRESAVQGEANESSSESGGSSGPAATGSTSSGSLESSSTSGVATGDSSSGFGSGSSSGSDSSSEGSSDIATGASTGAPVEICDGTDNDGDGLIDEASPANEECDGCDLAEIDGRAYWACPGPTAWGFAGLCAPWGADPARVSTAAQINWLKGLGGEEVDDGYWIGATDEGQEDDWRWADGTPADLDPFFAFAQPNGGTAQNCALVWEGGPDVGVHDYLCGESLRFACSADLYL